MEYDVIFVWVALFLFFLMIFCAGRVIVVEEAPYRKYCDLKYGEAYFYETAVGKPREIRACTFISEDGDATTKYFSTYAAKSYLKSYCDVPSFFELNKWTWDCGG